MQSRLGAGATDEAQKLAALTVQKGHHVK